MKNIKAQAEIKQKADKLLNEMYPTGVNATLQNAIYYDIRYNNVISESEITPEKIQKWIDKHFEIT